MLQNKLFGYLELLQNAIKSVLLLLKGTHLLSPKAKEAFLIFALFFFIPKKTGEEGFASAAARAELNRKTIPFSSDCKHT